jgi:hypothetical protein
MCDFEQVVNLFPCFSGTDVKGHTKGGIHGWGQAVCSECKLFIVYFVAADNCSSICKSEYSAKKLSAQVEKSSSLTSMSRNHSSEYGSAHELSVWTLRWPDRLSHCSGYYSAEECLLGYWRDSIILLQDLEAILQYMIMLKKCHLRCLATWPFDQEI